MRRLIFLIVILVTISSCSKSENNSGVPEKPIILTSIIPLKDIVLNITGTDFEVEALIPAGSSHETYEPEVQVVKKMAKAKALILTGTDLLFEKTISGWDKSPDIRTITLEKGIEIFEHNPHIWLGIEEVKKMSMNLAESLSSLFPEKANDFMKRQKAFAEKLDSAEIIVSENLNPLKEQYIVTYHPAWKYLLSRYGIREISIESHGKEPNAGEMLKIFSRIRESGVKKIFVEPQFDNSVVNTIRSELKIDIVMVNPLPENIIANFIEVSKKFATAK